MSTIVATFVPLVAISVNDIELYGVIAFAVIATIANALKKLPKKPPGPTGPADRAPPPLPYGQMPSRPPGPVARPSAETTPTAFEPPLYRRREPVQRKSARPTAVVAASPVIPVPERGRPASMPVSMVSRAVPDAVAPRVQQLLQDRTSLQAAFMLSELLAAPLALREERRP